MRVYIDSRARPDRRDQVAEVVASIRRHVQHLDIAVTDSRSAANVMVTLVRDRDLPRTIRKFYGRAQARQIQSSLTPQCLSSFRKDEAYRIVHSDVILVADAGDFVFYDCVYEELLQALGPINDTDAVPWTMFNDDVRMGFFDVYDQYILNILYDPRIRPGMTADEARAVLPQVLADVKAFVARTNDLELPARLTACRFEPTPRCRSRSIPRASVTRPPPISPPCPRSSVGRASLSRRRRRLEPGCAGKFGGSLASRAAFRNAVGGGQRSGPRHRLSGRPEDQSRAAHRRDGRRLRASAPRDRTRAVGGGDRLVAQRGADGNYADDVPRSRLQPGILCRLGISRTRTGGTVAAAQRHPVA